MNFFRWLGTAVEDQAGSVSSKRVVAYGNFVLVVQQVWGSLHGLTVDPTIFIGTLTAMLLALGLTIPEWFSELKKGSNGNTQ